jgi:hypothetical protein
MHSVMSVKILAASISRFYQDSAPRIWRAYWAPLRPFLIIQFLIFFNLRTAREICGP